MARIALVIGALLASLLTVHAIPQYAHADSGCPTPAGSYAGGAGTEADPWQIATKEQFQRLRDDSITGWDDSFILTNDITMDGCIWTSVIGDPGVAQFTGKIDGDGHVISGLDVSLTDNVPLMYAGLIGYLGGGGTITEVGFTGSVTAVKTGGGGYIFAGGLAGRTTTGATISYAYATGSVTTTAVPFPFTRAVVGGLVGEINGGTISNSYATGAVTSSDGRWLYVGGFAGKTAPTPSAVISKSYSTGTPTGSGGLSINVGGFIGLRGGSDLASDNFWDTTTSGTATGVGGGGDTTGIAGASTAQMQAFSTYHDSSWAITDGWDTFSLSSTPHQIWGICAGNTRAFLLWQYASTPCPPPPPPPPTPATAPFDVSASAGDASVTASWSPPASSGSYSVTNYLATASPGGRMCLSSTTTCTITGLTNGVTYSVRVQALTGAGWSEQSAPSNIVTPQRSTTTSLSIAGSHGSGADRRLVTIRGTSTGLAGQRVTMWFSFNGEAPSPSKSTATIRPDGTFTWSRRTNRDIILYAEAAGVRSNSVTVRVR